MNILVTGGAGYIGSHACKLLARTGARICVVDNFSRGLRENSKWGKLFEGDVRDTDWLSKILVDENIDLVMHFAAYAYVGESIQLPSLYYENNLGGTLSLLKAMNQANVRKLVFSSTCATYGNIDTESLPVDENYPQQPINPYGRSKYFCEQIIADNCIAGLLDAVVFRYFNAAGADPDAEIGECHDPETHLIPLAIRAGLGVGPELTIFGDDYETGRSSDKTAIRDYIHVNDISQAHISGADFLLSASGFHAFNLGNGKGYSILDVISAVEFELGGKVPLIIGSRRQGDPPILIGSAEKANRILGWRAQITSIRDIVKTAIRWERKRCPS